MPRSSLALGSITPISVATFTLFSHLCVSMSSPLRFVWSLSLPLSCKKRLVIGFAKFLDRTRVPLFGIISKILSLITKWCVQQNSKFMLWPRRMQEPGLFTEGGRSFLEKNVHRMEKRRSQCFQKNGGYGFGLRTLLPCQKGPDWGPQDVYLPIIVQFSTNNGAKAFLVTIHLLIICHL